MTTSQMTVREHYNKYKQDNYESKTIQLTSPMLHIGSEVSKLNRFEYVQSYSKVYIPNREALARAFYDKGTHFLQDYITAIENDENIQKLLENTFGEDWKNIEYPEGVPVFPDVRPKWTQDSQPVTDLRPMICNGRGQLYIPGSAIKGAIRTAIAYHLLKHGDRYRVPASYQVSEIERKLREKLNKGEIKDKYKQKFLDDDLFMDELFSNYKLQYQNHLVKKATSQNTDILRAVKVSDSQPLIPGTITNKKGKKLPYNLAVVAEAIVSSHYEDWRAKYRASIYTELVRNARAEFTVTLDREMLSWFRHNKGMKLPFQTIDELLNICQEFAREQWDGEFDYWSAILYNKDSGKSLNFDLVREFYQSEKCPYNLRIGWGSGMTGITIDWLLQDETRSQLRDTCGIAAPKFEAPKSRRTIVDAREEIRYVPGWVKFRLL